MFPLLSRTARLLAAAALAFLCVTGMPANASAQGVLPKPVGPNTLSGIVTDTLDSPIADVDVLIIKLQRRTRTRADGTFRFDSVSPGTYDVRARGIGLVAPSPRVRVGPNGGAVHIRMLRFGTILPAMVTTANRGGLQGVIGDTSYRAMPNVAVTVLGTGETARTDSSGAFFMPLRPGHYMLRIERDGFARQIVGVTIPEDEGRRIAAWMVPQTGKPNPVEGMQLFDLNQRLMRASPASSRFFSREDLEKRGLPDLQSLAIRSANGIVTPDCMVLVNGGPTRVPLGVLATSELEFVEMYLASNTDPGSATRGVTSISGNGTKFTTPAEMRPRTTSECGNLAFVAWLRQ